MKITRNFVYKIATDWRHESGWVVHDKPHFDAVRHYGGRSHVLIHDIMEHHNSDGNSIVYELLALGGAYFIRVEGEWGQMVHGFHGTHGTMKMDTEYFANLVKYKIPKCHRPEPFSTTMKEYRAIMLDKLHESYTLDHKIFTVIDDMFQWYNKGYNRAVRRWEGHTAKAVCDMWEKMHQMIRGTELSYTGVLTPKGRLAVTFDTVKLSFTVRWYEGRKLMLKTSG